MAQIGIAPASGYVCSEMHSPKIPDGTLSLRVVIYGRGRAMPSEPDIQRVARSNAHRLYCECADGLTRPVSRESYLGSEVLIPLTDFAWQTERAGTPLLPGAASDILCGDGTDHGKWQSF